MYCKYLVSFRGDQTPTNQDQRRFQARQFQAAHAVQMLMTHQGRLIVIQCSLIISHNAAHLYDESVDYSMLEQVFGTPDIISTSVGGDGEGEAFCLLDLKTKRHWGVKNSITQILGKDFDLIP